MGAYVSLKMNAGTNCKCGMTLIALQLDALEPVSETIGDNNQSAEFLRSGVIV